MADVLSVSSSDASDAYMPFDDTEEADPHWQQHSAFNVYNLPESLPPEIEPHDQDFLEDRTGWIPIPIDSTDDRAGPSNLFYVPNDPTWKLNSYHPYWTRPGFDLRRQEQIIRPEGPVYRFHDDGSGFKSWRPAILPADRSKFPTEYALRFGIDPRAPKSSTGQARSRFTPITERYQYTWQTSENKEADEGVQRSYQYGYTSAELAEIGAYDPHKEVVPADLDGQLHPFVQQSRWTQKPWPFEKNMYWGGTWNILYNLGGDHARYNVNTNPRVWQAIKPSLHLVTKVLMSRPPIFDILGNFYHLRRVQSWRDREDLVELKEFGHRKAVYFDIDESRAYPTARLLKNYACFDPKKAADAMLDAHFKLSLVNHMGEGFTLDGDKNGDWEVRLCINVSLIWPLLEPKYSDADRAPCHYALATTILHEMAHAYQDAVNMMLTNPNYLRNTAYGQTLPPDIFHLLKKLGDEMLPPYQPNIYQLLGHEWDGLLRGNGLLGQYWFFEDENKPEEGWATENQVWGGTITSSPFVEGGRIGPFHSPAIISNSWPEAHSQPYDDIETHAADSTPNVWSTSMAIPTDTYAAYFRNSWWDCDYRKFSALALRLKSYDITGKPLRATLFVNDEDMTAEISRALRSPETARWLLDTAHEHLCDAGCEVLASYLRAATFEVASAKTFRRRLYYERRTWDRKFRRLRENVQTAFVAFETWDDTLGEVLQHGVVYFTDQNIHGTLENMRVLASRMLQVLLDIKQCLGQDIMYSQAIVELYLQQGPRDRSRIHRRYMRDLLTRLREISTHATTLSGRLHAVLSGANDESGNDRKCEIVIRRKIVNDLIDPLYPTVRGWQDLWRCLTDDLDCLRNSSQALIALGAAADDVTNVLVLQADEDRLNPASSSSSARQRDRGDPSVSRARSRQPTRMLRAAAMRQLRELDGRQNRYQSAKNNASEDDGSGSGSTSSSQRPVPVDKLASRLDRIALQVARRWIHILHAHPDLRRAEQDWRLGILDMARRFDVEGCEDERRAELMTEARSLMENERKERMNRAMFRSHVPPPSSNSSDEGVISIEQGRGEDVLPAFEEEPGIMGGPTMAEVRAAIGRLAGRNDEDAEYLRSIWTEDRIQMLLNGDTERLDIATDMLGI